MNQDKKELLFSYIKVNIAPIIVDFISAQDIPNAVIIDAINNPDLFGHFVGTLYLPPEWFEKTNKNVILVIDNLDKISKEEQLKFKELLKYKKISTFNLPEDMRILVTVENKENLNEEIYSLLISL